MEVADVTPDVLDDLYYSLVNVVNEIPFLDRSDEDHHGDEN